MSNDKQVESVETLLASQVFVPDWMRKATEGLNLVVVTRKVTLACGSGWTGDRCTKRLGHRGLHSNE